MVLFAHTPCRSGWPSGVRGAVQAFTEAAVLLGVDGVCAVREADASAAITDATANRPRDGRNCEPISSLLTRTLPSALRNHHCGSLVRPFVRRPDSGRTDEQRP